MHVTARMPQHKPKHVPASPRAHKRFDGVVIFLLTTCASWEMCGLSSEQEAVASTTRAAGQLHENIRGYNAERNVLGVREPVPRHPQGSASSIRDFSGDVRVFLCGELGVTKIRACGHSCCLIRIQQAHARRVCCILLLCRCTIKTSCKFRILLHFHAMPWPKTKKSLTPPRESGALFATDFPVCPKCLAALLCGSAIRKNVATSLQVSDEVEKTLVDW